MIEDAKGHSTATKKLDAQALLQNCPYRGLRSFDPADGSIFWGRDRAVADLRDRIADHHVLFVLGGSGGGKSSLVKAGLIPSLRGFGGIRDRPGRWYIAVCRPGEQPIDSVRLAFENLLKDWGGTDEEREAVRSITAGGNINLGLLGRFVDSILPDIDRREQGTVAHPPNLLLLIDQFEELFGERVPSQERDRVIAAICDVQRTKPQGVFITATMRSENLHDCAEFVGLAEVVNQTFYLLGRMSDAELREAIEEPARQVFEDFGLDPDLPDRGRFHTGFVDQLCAARGAMQRGGDDHKADNLPLIQHALTRIWQATFAGTPSDAECWPVLGWEVMGLPGEMPTTELLVKTLRDGADQARDAAALRLDMASPEMAQLRLGRMFTGLAQRKASGVYSRTLLHVAEAAAIAETDEARVRLALTVFDEKGFLNRRGDGEFEVSHEALVRRWGWFRNWVDTSADAAAALREAVPGAETELVGRKLNRGLSRKFLDGRGAEAAEVIDPKLAVRLEPVFARQVSGASAIFLGPQWAIALLDRDRKIASVELPNEAPRSIAEPIAPGRSQFENSGLPSAARLVSEIGKLRDAATTWRARQRLKQRAMLVGCFVIVLMGIGITWIWNQSNQLLAKNSSLAQKNEEIENLVIVNASLANIVLNANRMDAPDIERYKRRAVEVMNSVNSVVRSRMPDHLILEKSKVWQGIYGSLGTVLGMVRFVSPTQGNQEERARCARKSDGQTDLQKSDPRPAERMISADDDYRPRIAEDGNGKLALFASDKKANDEFVLEDDARACVSADGGLLLWTNTFGLLASPLRWYCAEPIDGKCQRWKVIVVTPLLLEGPDGPRFRTFRDAVDSKNREIFTGTEGSFESISWGRRDDAVRVGVGSGFPEPKRLARTFSEAETCMSQAAVQCMAATGKIDDVEIAVRVERDNDDVSTSRTWIRIFLDPQNRGNPDGLKSQIYGFRHVGPDVKWVSVVNNSIVWADAAGTYWTAFLGPRHVTDALTTMAAGLQANGQ